MAKYESANDEDYDDFIKATLKFTRKMKKPDEFHFESIRFFKHLNNETPDQQTESFKQFDRKLEFFPRMNIIEDHCYTLIFTDGYSLK